MDNKFTIAFIGGSITQGFFASDPELCYAKRVFNWFVKKFPDIEFEYVNAGIGATDSFFGAARVQSDILAYKPDLVFVEFSVNDKNNEFFEETYEGLVRRIMYDENSPTVCLIHSVCYDDGVNAEDVHKKIAKHYNLTSISMKQSIYKEMLEGKYTKDELTKDGLHPTDLGHELMANEIVSNLTDIYGKKHERIAPLTRNRYENACRYNASNCKPISADGFDVMTESQNGVADCFKGGWKSTGANASIEFEVSGSEIAIVYRRYAKGNAPVAYAVVDGDESSKIKLDANFDEDWGDKLEITPILQDGKNVSHTVKIFIEKYSGFKESFELISIVAARGN